MRKYGYFVFRTQGLLLRWRRKSGGVFFCPKGCERASVVFCRLLWRIRQNVVRFGSAIQKISRQHGENRIRNTIFGRKIPFIQDRNRPLWRSVVSPARKRAEKTVNTKTQRIRCGKIGLYRVFCRPRFRRRGAGDGQCKKKRQVFHKPCRKTIGSAQRRIKTKNFFRAKRTLCAKNIEINLFTVL